MTHQEIRSKFLNFLKHRGHAIVSSSSLLPDDPSVLFTTAGMQQFKPYYVGKADPMKDFGSYNTASIQKCIRTSDIDEVGDERHLTFFEMLGNFSFGGYFKKEAIEWAHEFVTKEMGLKIDYVSIFTGEEGIPRDDESELIWRTLDPNIRIEEFGRNENFWGPTGDEGPCGPTTEIYVDGIEIWNVVFNQYYCNKDKSLAPLEKPGIDTGMGLERLAKVSQKVETVFETDLFLPITALLPDKAELRVTRVMADHARSIAFLISDGVRPSNKEQGYVLRRLMRRFIVHEHLLNAPQFHVHDLFEKIVVLYGKFYPNLNVGTINLVFTEEKEKFSKTFKNGLKELGRIQDLDASSAFKLYESFGLPYEIIKELGGDKAGKLTREGFDAKFKEHQEKSRAGAEKKFGGHGLLLDTGELKAADETELKKVTRLHTSTHLLHAALRKVLGDEVKQAGSDITAERLRFDFSFPRKLTVIEVQQVEDLVNLAVQQDFDVTKTTMPYDEAIKTGALYFFKEKYPPTVNVYWVGDQSKGIEEAFSKEFCGGPHVEHTGVIGKVKITKEEAVSAGVRRIRATVE